jgi:two-component system, cell cycle response regulator
VFVTDEIREKILSCTTLPTLPAIAVQVLELAQKDEVDLNQIASRITQDPALTGKILKTVNSSFYGRSNAVGTVNHALVILGLQSVKTLVLGFSLVGNLSKERSHAFDHMKYWRRAIFAATATRVICSKINFVQQEEAFLATLLQDIGVLVLERVFGPTYHEIYSRATSHHDLSVIELAELGTTHAEVGAMIAGSWKLPPVLLTPIRLHHAPEQCNDPALTGIAHVVALGGRCGDVFVDQNPAPAIADVREAINQNLLENAAMPIDADALLSEIGHKTREAATLFDISLKGAELDYTAIMKKANDALIELSLRSQQRASQLVEQNEQLKVKASIDRLTGLANRATFDEFFAEHFAKSAADGAPLSLVLLDVDKFKSVNDQHGHPAGDAVLQHIGALLRGMAREGDLAARYGGEELVLVLPDTPRALAATVAETVRRAIAARPISCGASAIPITASFGVATLERGSPFKIAAHLLKAADLAVYKAKHSGRNNVKVFAPATPKAA